MLKKNKFGKFSKTRLSKHIETHFGRCHTQALNRFVEYSITRLVLLQLIQIYEIKLVTQFPVLRLNKGRQSYLTYLGDLSTYSMTSHDEATDFYILDGILLYQSAKFLAFWLIFYFMRPRSSKSKGALKPIIVNLNILDREILILPIFFFAGLGFRINLITAVISVCITLIFAMNQAIVALFDFEYSFEKKKINSSYSIWHQYCFCLALGLSAVIRGAFGDGGLVPLVVKLISSVTGFYLLADIRSYLHYWRNSRYQIVYLVKISVMFCLGIFHLITEVTNWPVYANIDLWMITIFFLIFKLTLNGLKNSETRLLQKSSCTSEDVGLGALTCHEVVITVLKLLSFHNKSREKKEPNLQLLTYMRRHLEECKDMFCPCRRCFIKYDFTKSKTYQPNPKDDSEAQLYRLKVINKFKFTKKGGKGTRLMSSSYTMNKNRSLIESTRSVNVNTKNRLGVRGSFALDDGDDFGHSENTRLPRVVNKRYQKSLRKPSFQEAPGNTSSVLLNNFNKKRSFEKKEETSSIFRLKKSNPYKKHQKSILSKKLQIRVNSSEKYLVVPTQQKKLLKTTQRIIEGSTQQSRDNQRRNSVDQLADRSLVSMLLKTNMQPGSCVFDPSGSNFKIFLDKLMQTYLEISRRNVASVNILYISFLFSELKNYILSLVQCYKLIFSPKTFESVSFKSRIILRNYLNLAKEQLKLFFFQGQKRYHLTTEKFFRIFDYQQRTVRLKQKISDMIDQKVEFYHEMAFNKINYNKLRTLAKQINQLQKEIDPEFEALLKVSKANNSLLYLYTNYRLNVINDTNFKFQKMKEMIHLNKQSGHQQKFLSKSPFFNPYRSNNMFIFSSLQTSGFRIERFTNNAAEFFGYDLVEFSKLRIQDLMPEIISEKHDDYMTSFINQCDKKIYQVSPLTSFAVKKDTELVKVHILTKLDYLLAQDAYISALITPAKDHHRRTFLLLDDHGKLIGMSNYARMIFGDELMHHSYYLYYLLPGLIDLMRNSPKDSYQPSFRDVQRDRVLVKDRKSTFLFFFKNMDNEQVKHSSFLKPRVFNEWNLGEASEVEIANKLNFIKKKYLEKKVNFVEKMDEVRIVKATFKKYKYKHGVVVKYVELSGFVPIQRHQKRFLMLYANGMRQKPARMLTVDPENLYAMKSVLKKKAEIDAMIYKLFTFMTENKFSKVVEDVINQSLHMASGSVDMEKDDTPPVAANIIEEGEDSSSFFKSISSGSKQSPQKPEDLNQTVISEEQDHLSQTFLGVESSDGIVSRPSAKIYDNNYNNLNVDHGLLKVMGSTLSSETRNSKGKPHFKPRMIRPTLDCCGKDDEADFGLDGVGNVVETEGVSFEYGAQNSKTLTYNPCGKVLKKKTLYREIQSFRGRTSSRKVSVVSKKFRRKINDQAKFVVTLERQLSEMRKRTRGNGFTVIGSMIYKLKKKINGLRTDLETLDNNNQTHKLEEILINFDEKELETFNNKQTDATSLVIPRELQRAQTGLSSNLHELDWSRMSHSAESRLDALFLRNGKSEKSKGGSSGAYQEMVTGTTQKMEEWINNGKAQGSKKSSGSIYSTVYCMEMRTSLDKFPLRRIITGRSGLFYLSILLLFGVISYLKTFKDAGLRDAVLNSQKAIKVAWPIISTGKMYRLVIRNKLAIKGFVNTSVSTEYEGYMPDVIDLSLTNLELSIYPYISPEARQQLDSDNATNILNYTNSGIWAKKLLMKFSNHTSGSLEIQTHTIGILMSVLYHQFHEFADSFDEKTQRFNDLSEIDTEAFVYNVASLDEQLLILLKQIFEAQLEVWESILTEYLIGTAFFTLFGAFIALYIYGIINQIDQQRFTVAGFIIKANKILVVKELMRLVIYRKRHTHFAAKEISRVVIPNTVKDSLDEGGFISQNQSSLQKSLFSSTRNKSALSTRMKSSVRRRNLSTTLILTSSSVDIPACFALLQNQNRLTQFTSKGRAKKEIKLFILVLGLLIFNIPVILNYLQVSLIKGSIRELSLIKRKNIERMSFQNIAFAITYHRYLQDFEGLPEYRLPKKLTDIEQIVQGYFQQNFLLEYKALIESHVPQIYDDKFCESALEIFEKHKKECLFVTSGNDKFHLPYGFNKMITFYKEIRANQGNLVSFDTASVWKNEKISFFNLVHSVEIDQYVQEKIEYYLEEINQARYLFIAMLAILSIGFGLFYRVVYHGWIQEKWMDLLLVLKVCSDSVLCSCGGLRSYLSSRHGLV